MFDKDGKLDARSRAILSEQTVPPRYGLSPDMTAGPPMTATEIVELEKAYFADWAAKQSSNPDPLQPVIEALTDIVTNASSAE